MAADFNKPVTTDSYVDLLAMLRANQEVLARMFATGATVNNIPVGAVRFDAGKFQTWNGSAWVDVPVSVDGGGTGAQSALAARQSLGTHDAANLTAGVMSADRVPGLDASKLISGTLSLDTNGNAATATYATSAGSATWSGITDKPAVIAAGATQQAAREAVGIGNAMIADQASISASGNTGYVTTSHSAQVNASYNSKSSGANSQVNASYISTASGANSQVSASYNSTASGANSQVNASDSSTASGENSQVNANYGSTASGEYSQVNASYISTASGAYSQVNCSSFVANENPYSLAMGYAASGGASTANQKIRLESITGVGRFKGSTTTTGFDYAEFFHNLANGEIPVGTIVTLDGDKVKPAQDGDFILGVISETYGVLGNSADFCWHGRELRNEFGGVIKHDVEMVRWTNGLSRYDGRVADAVDIPADATYYTVNMPMENPDYVDQGSNYVDRSARKDEWSIIGLMGQVYARVYADIPNNSFVSAGGLPSNNETNLYCMTMTTPYDADKGYGVAKCLIR